MKKRKTRSGYLSLESLEDRTLLAGIFDESDFADAYEAASSVEFSFEPAKRDEINDSVAVWRGNETAEITVFANELPDGIDVLKFFEFSSVKIVGERNIGIVTATSVEQLFIESDLSKDVGSFEGALHAVDVSLISFSGETPEFMSLRGNRIFLDAPLGLGENNTLLLVRANELNMDFGEDMQEHFKSILLTELAYQEGKSLTLSLLDIDPAEIDFSQEVDTDTSGGGEPIDLVDSDELSRDELVRVLEALQLLNQNKALFELDEFNELKAALTALASSATESEEITGLANTEAIQFGAINDTTFQVSEIEDYDGQSESSAQLAEDDIEVDSIQPGLELRETETGMKVFVLNDSNAAEANSNVSGSLEEMNVGLEAELAEHEEVKSAVVARMSQSLNGLDKLVALLSRTQSAGEALRSHLMNKISDELTPGGQVGLLVDGSRGVVRKDFIQRDS